MTENLHTPDCIRTVSGQYVNVFDPDPKTILIEDIAHALSHQCRFGGHLPVFYSVALHSIMCSRRAAPEHKLAALLHDASEAYLLDIPRPIKRRLTNYIELEDNLMKIIATKFGFTYPLSDAVKAIDEAVLQDEWDVLVLGENSVLAFMHHPFSAVDFTCYSSDYAKKHFISAFEKLKK